MKYNLLWMHLLNAEIDARARAQLGEHLRRLLGPKGARLDDALLDEQRAFLRSLREAWVRLGRLGAVTSELAPLLTMAGGPSRSGLVDGLLAPGLGSTPTDRAQLGQLLRRAALLGFAGHLHDHAFAEEPTLVDRCAGLTALRPGQEPSWEASGSFSPLADEETVSRQLGAAASGEFERCGCLFARVGRGDYCSKSCRDRSFALARRHRDPRYDADKQRRYRARLKQAQSGAAG